MKKNKEFYLIFLWIILIFTIVIIFIFPNINKISAAANKINTTLAKLENLEKTNQNKQEMEKNYQLIKNNYPTLEQLVPKAGEELNFITSLEEIASRNNVQQKMNLLPQEEGDTKTRGFNILPFQLTLDGNLYNIFNYLNDLENNNYYLNIDKIKIDKNFSPTKTFIEEPVINPNNVHVILTGNSYWQ